MICRFEDGKLDVNDGKSMVNGVLYGGRCNAKSEMNYTSLCATLTTKLFQVDLVRFPLMFWRVTDPPSSSEG